MPQNDPLDRILGALEQMCREDELELTLEVEQVGDRYVYTMAGPDPESIADPGQRWAQVQKCLARSALFHMALALSTGLPRSRLHVVRPTGELEQAELDLLSELTGCVAEVIRDKPGQLDVVLTRIREIAKTPSEPDGLNKLRDNFRQLRTLG